MRCAYDARQSAWLLAGLEERLAYQAAAIYDDDVEEHTGTFAPTSKAPVKSARAYSLLTGPLPLVKLFTSLQHAWFTEGLRFEAVNFLDQRWKYSGFFLRVS